MFNNDPDDSQNNPDWYGQKSKRKRDFRGRRGMLAPFAFGFLVALVMLLCGGLALITARLSASTAVILVPTYTASPTLTQTVTPTQTATPTRTPRPTATSRLVATAQRRNGIVFFRPGDTDHWSTVQFPPEGYSYRGLQLDKTHIYVAQTRGFSNGKCDPNEGYWVYSVNSLTQSAFLADSSMSVPKQIAVDDEGNSYVIALDCVHAQPAIFKFTKTSNLVSAFSVVGADDVLVLDSNRILVSLSGFPCTSESDEQQHLIVLQPNEFSNGWPQPVRGASDSCNATYHSMVRFGDTIYMIRSAPNQVDKLMTFPIPPIESDDYRATSSISLEKAGEPIIDLAITKDMNLVGLGKNTSSVFTFKDGQITDKTNPIGKNVQSFATAPWTDRWYYVVP